MLQHIALPHNVSASVCNENGFTIVISMMILVLLTIIGIAATNTTQIELTIGGNEKIYRQNFNLAEAGVMECAQTLNQLDGIVNYDDLMPGTTTLRWLHNNEDNTNLAFDFTQPAGWDNNQNSANVNSIQSLAGSSYGAGYKGKVPGSSLKSGEVSINNYSVYGLSQNNRGEVLIKIGCKKPVLNP